MLEKGTLRGRPFFPGRSVMLIFRRNNRVFAPLLLIFFLCGGVLFSKSVCGQPPPPLIPRAEIFSDAAKGMVKISPDGRQISYRAVHEDGLNLFIAPPDAPEKAAPIFEKDDVPVLDYEWAYTKRHLLWLSRKGESERFTALDLETKRKKDLVSGAGGELLRIERLSPALPEKALISVGRPNSAPERYYLIDILTGIKTSVFENTGGFSDLLFDARLRPALARKPLPGGGFELFVPGGNDGWKSFLKIPEQNTRESRPFSVDRRGRTLFMVDNLTTDRAVLKAYDLETGRARILAADKRADLSPVLLVDPLTHEVESATAYYGDMRRHFLDRSLKKDFRFLEKKHPGDIGIAGRSLDDRRWLVVYLDGGPLKFYFYDRRAKKVSFLFSTHPALDKYELAERRMVEIKVRDGLKFPAHLYLPPRAARNGSAGRIKRKLPLLIYVHGGPTVAYPWNSFYTNRVFQLLANRGYAVLRVEFRGAGGFGKKIAAAGDLEWGGKMQDDLLDAAEWAVRRGIAEKNRIGIFGWSYGGYATIAALAFRPEAFACGIALYPVTDLAALLRLNPDFWRVKLGDERTPAGRELLRERSPLFFAESITRPLLITHGGRDRRATPDHSDRFVEAMKRADKPVTYLFYPDEPHDYRRNQNWISFFAVAERFLATHLGGRFEPSGDDLRDVAFEVRAGAELIPGLSGIRKTE